MSRKLIVAAVLFCGCSRAGTPSARGSAVDAAAIDIAEASAPTSIRVIDAAPEAAAVAKPSVEASPPVEITLANAPTLVVRAIGPSLIEVALRDKAPAAWKTIEVERHAVGEERRQHGKLARHVGGDRRARALRHAAKPATAYAYRARANGGPWSAEVTVTTADPGAAPAVPTALVAKALGPFAVRLAWQADARMAAGFEIEVSSPGKDWVRVAVVDPTDRSFEHHHRLPKRDYTYRVRAFNAQGGSAPSASAALTMPERGPEAPSSLPPCKALPKPGAAPQLGLPQEIVNATAAHPLHNVPEGANGLRRHLFGEYQGCFRDFGVFELQDSAVSEIEDYADEGFPLLRGIAGAGEFAGAQILTLRFARGRYTVVDTAVFCGAPYPDPDPDDPTVGTEAEVLEGFSPTFATCQRDYQR